MAKGVQSNNIYSELFENLTIPERLSPENIAAMLDASSAADRSRSKITVSSAPLEINKKTPGGSGSKHGSSLKKGVPAAYRAVASVAACAVMALGLVRYFDVGKSKLPDTEPKGSAFAENYDQLHKTFRKYYVDDSEKKTLDSAIAEIEHSYIDGKDNVVTDKVENPGDKDTVQTAPVGDNMPDVSENPNTPVTNPDFPEPDHPVQAPDIGGDIGSRLPAVIGAEDSGDIVVNGNKIFVIDGSTVKVILTSNGQPEYIGDAVPECGIFETKKLERVFAVGDRLVVVYSVVNEEPISVPAFDDNSDSSVIGDLMNSFYAQDAETIRTESVEITVYDILPDGMIVRTGTASQQGTLVDVRENGGCVYAVTEYNNYRRSPLVGVDDLECYVPSYIVNGEKRYIQPENILIPEYVATTDYTVITGIAAGMPEIPVSVQAVLGTEGKVVLTDNSVYVFGYSEESGVEKTVCERFRLSNGGAVFEGSVSVNGVAVQDGIHADNGVIFVATISNNGDGYITGVSAMDAGMNIISKIDFPAAMNKISFDGSKVYLTNGYDSYAADFTAASAPVLIEYGDDIDVTKGLVRFGRGYVTLVKSESGELILSELITDENGGLSLGADTVVCSESEAGSKALDNNSLMYTDPLNGFIGVPYGFFDGYDYCYRFALYRLTNTGFIKIGEIESHEVDEAFEISEAFLNNGILYIFSEGRIYSAAVSQDALSKIGSAELIDSSYSGHTER